MVNMSNNNGLSNNKLGAWPIYCNPYSLASAFENIVRNALRYSNSRIEVAFTELLSRW